VEKLSASPSALPDLAQESTVEIGERSVTVVTRVLVDPEVLVVNEVRMGERVLRKRHTPAPAATVAQYEQRGPAALSSYLLASHLRFVRRLLTANETASETASQTRSEPIPAGVVATMVLGKGGEVLASAGEDHVPGAWLRATYLLEAVAKRAEELFDWGGVETVAAEGDGVHVRMRRGAERTAVCFSTQVRADEEPAIRRHLEEVACAGR